MEINTQSLPSTRGWQINNFIPSQVQSHLFPPASDQERTKEMVHVNALKKIKGSAHGAFVGDFCSNTKSSALVCRLEWGRHTSSYHALSIHLYCNPYPKSSTETQEYMLTHTLCCKSLSLDGKARGQGMRTEKKDACGHIFLQKWKESPLTLKSCRWVIPSHLTLILATWVALAKETLSNKVQVRFEKCFDTGSQLLKRPPYQWAQGWEKRGQIMRSDTEPTTSHGSEAILDHPGNPMSQPMSRNHEKY